jgi:hypothetical protein
MKFRVKVPIVVNNEALWICISLLRVLMIVIMNTNQNSRVAYEPRDRLCSLVVSIADYKQRGPGFDSRALIRIFLRELGLERGPLSLVIG